MPALPSVPGVLRLIFPFAFADGGPVAHVRQYWTYSGGPPTFSDGVALANEAMTLAAAHMAGEWPSFILLDAIRLTDMASPTGTDALATHGAIPGTNSGAALPQETATVVKYEVPRRYRGGHPKEFWPIGTQADMEDELHWTDAWLTAVDTNHGAVQTGLQGFVAGTTTLVNRVNVSFYLGFTVHTGTTGRARNVPVTRATPLVDVCGVPLCQKYISQQRRRRGKV